MVKFSSKSKISLATIQRGLHSRDHQSFYDKLSSNICSIVRDQNYQLDKEYPVEVQEKTIPGISVIHILFKITRGTPIPAEEIVLIIDIKAS